MVIIKKKYLLLSFPLHLNVCGVFFSLYMFRVSMGVRVSVLQHFIVHSSNLSTFFFFFALGRLADMAGVTGLRTMQCPQVGLLRPVLTHTKHALNPESK